MALLKSKDYMPQVDVNGNIQSIEQIQLESRIAAPTDTFLTAGRLYYDSVLGGLYAYIGTTWTCINTANAANFTSAAAVAFAGAYAFTGTLTGITGVTFPTAGTLATLAGTETLSGKTLTTPIVNGLKVKVNAKSANYTVVATDVLIPVTTGSSADVTITLPAATGTGLYLIIKKIDSGNKNVVIDGAGSETIDGALTKTISTQYGAVVIVDAGTGVWDLVSTLGTVS